ncbi:MAG: hypothetical protein R3344_14095 [Acidobacteriota bacterium]|nr:hypothetical protein [Acidobacteriota bacterium]
MTLASDVDYLGTPQRSPREAPFYSAHRLGVDAVDSLPESAEARGINMADNRYANIQVVPTGGANPTVAVLWWSEAAGVFVQEHTPITRAGVGADTPFEFTVEAHGRTMFVAVTALAAGAVDILVSSSGRTNP